MKSQLGYGKVVNDQLLDVCRMMLEGSGKTELWFKSIIVTVPKKGDFSEPHSYRGIALILTAAKIYNRMLLNRTRPHLDPLLRTNQNGFRPGRWTVA